MIKYRYIAYFMFRRLSPVFPDNQLTTNWQPIDNQVATQYKLSQVKLI